MIKNVLAGLLVASAAFAAGCSNSDNNGDTGAVGGGGGGGTVPQALAIEDKWESTCAEAGLFGLSESSRLTVASGSFTRLTRYHTNGTCGAEAIQFEQTGDFLQTSGSAENVLNVDFAVSQVKVTPVSRAGADILRLANFCGISDWTVGVAKDVTEQSGTDRCIPKLPQTIYEIYTVEGNTLYFGKGENLTDPAKRPTEIDRDLAYARQ